MPTNNAIHRLDAIAASMRIFVGCVRYGEESTVVPDSGIYSKSVPLRRRMEVIVEHYQVQELRSELNHLLQKQAEFVESKSLGGATDSEVLEYEIRQEIIGEICDQLGHTADA